MPVRYRFAPLVVSVLSLVVAGFLASPARAQDPCRLEVGSVVEDLGNDRYHITFIMTNASPGHDVLFKWRLEFPSIPTEWLSVSFDSPPGWDATYDPGRLDFQIPNASGELRRVYSASAAAQCGGPNSLQFGWTFDRNGGPFPPQQLYPEDFKTHVQMVSLTTCDNIGNSFICPLIVPTEGSTWGRMKAFYR